MFGKISRFFKTFPKRPQTAYQASQPWKLFGLAGKLSLICFSLAFAVGAIYVFLVFTYYMQISFVRHLAIWIAVLFLTYWICSAVWCLYDKDDYGRAVSASDDFYNVAFTALWLVEGFLLSLFISYTKLFNFYDPMLESDEIESTFRNEDSEGSKMLSALLSFLTVQYMLFVLDALTTWEAMNPYWLVCFLASVVGWLVVSFIKISIKFVEEMDFEEDGEDLFDDVDNVFEHEDFPDEGVDGGDYGEGYEILQLFFSYWHYLFILMHVCYLSYAVFAAKGKQTHVYWAVIAICQNLVIIMFLDLIDWGEVFLAWELISTPSFYSWFYISEDPSVSLTLYLNSIWQIIEFILSAGNSVYAEQFLNDCSSLSQIATGVAHEEDLACVLAEYARLGRQL